MNSKFKILLLIMITLDIIDGDFSEPSILKAIKWLLYVVCFVLIIISNKRGETK